MLCELQECDQSLALVAKIKVWKFCFGRLCFFVEDLPNFVFDYLSSVVCSTW